MEKEHSHCLKETGLEKYNNKRDFLIFSLVFTPRVTPVAEIGLWTLRPRFLRGFTPPCAPDPIFILLSGFPFENT